MKLVFLDFDGVLTTKRTHQRPLWEGTVEAGPETMEDRIKRKGDADCVKALNILLAQTKARIVVTSTWRKGKKKPNQASVVRVLKLWGVQGKVIGVTPMLFKDHVIIGADGKRIEFPISKERGHEIDAWLTQAHLKNQIPFDTKFVILDDEADMVHLSNRLVQTDFEHGLTMEHVARAIRMLA